MKDYRLTDEDNVILRVADNTKIPKGHRWWQAYEEWLSAGNMPDPVYTRDQLQEQLSATFERSIQGLLDAAAKSRGYDSIATAVSYAEEPAVPRFQEDGKSFRAWRSLVWAYAYQELAKVKSGEREIPALDAFLAELPALPEQAAA